MPGRYGLGVDTGGTFTDAVIMDMDSGTVVAKAKSPTTHDDLSVGLFASVDRVFQSCGISPDRIASIGVSTTLATNSVLEGVGGKVGLILIGWKPRDGMDFGQSACACVKGGFDHSGKMVEPLDEEEVREAVRKVADGCDAIAISGLYSVLNSSQEKAVKKIAMELTGLPTVMGSELSSILGIDERARTAVLNGKLIPVVKDFFDGLEKTFRSKGLTAPILVYKGDGSVMSMKDARVYPVESVFSGPAASSVGGRTLSGLSDFILIDIGGTSTDVAIVEDSLPDMQDEGADICGMRTHVKAVDMYTMALGGDSLIALQDSVIELPSGVTVPVFSISRNKSFNFSIGPERVVPLSVFSRDHPEILTKMAKDNVTEYYAFVKEPPASAGEKEHRIADLLRSNGAMGRLEIMQSGAGLWTIDSELKSLRDSGCIALGGLTPSDLMVYRGQFENGDPRGSKAGIRILAEVVMMTEEKYVDRLLGLIHSKIAQAIVTKLMDDKIPKWRSKESANILKDMTSIKHPTGFAVIPRIDVPIVCIGAPTKYLMGDVGKRLGAELIFPENGDVGNAVGAITSKMVESMTAVVELSDRMIPVCTIPLSGKTDHKSLEAAVQYAKEKMKEHLTASLVRAGAKNIEVKYRMKVYSNSPDGVWTKDDFDRAEIQAKAVGDPPLPE